MAGLNPQGGHGQLSRGLQAVCAESTELFSADFDVSEKCIYCSYYKNSDNLCQDTSLEKQILECHTFCKFFFSSILLERKESWQSRPGHGSYLENLAEKHCSTHTGSHFPRSKAGRRLFQLSHLKFFNYNVYAIYNVYILTKDSSPWSFAFTSD